MEPAWTPRGERGDWHPLRSRRAVPCRSREGTRAPEFRADRARAELKAGERAEETAARAQGRLAPPEAQTRAGTPPSPQDAAPSGRAGRAATAGRSPARSGGCGSAPRRGATSRSPRPRGGPDTSAPRSPTALTRPEPTSSECPPRARRGCARPAPGCGQGSGRSGRCRRRSGRWEPSGRRRRLQQQVSIKVLVRSLFPHSRRAQRRLQLFQNTRPVPPTPTSAVAPGGGWSVEEGDWRGAAAANFPPEPAGRPSLGRRAFHRGSGLHLPAGTGHGRRPPRWVRSDVGMGFTDRLEPAPHYPRPVGPGAHFSQRLLQSWLLTRTPSHHL